MDEDERGERGVTDLVSVACRVKVVERSEPHELLSGVDGSGGLKRAMKSLCAFTSRRVASRGEARHRRRCTGKVTGVLHFTSGLLHSLSWSSSANQEER
jgi:hypothetical protein